MRRGGLTTPGLRGFLYPRNRGEQLPGRSGRLRVVVCDGVRRASDLLCRGDPLDESLIQIMSMVLA